MRMEPDWREYNLTEETLFKREKAMPFWLVYPPGDFIQAIVHEVREEMMKIDAFIGYITNDQDVASQPLETLSGLQTVEENCESISRSTARLMDVMDVAWAYSKVQRAKDEDIESENLQDK